jgi:acyl carrier protein
LRRGICGKWRTFGGVEERLKRVLGEVFEMEEINSDSSPENVALWDSLHHLKMVTELETVFEARFSMREIGPRPRSREWRYWPFISMG